MPPIDDQKRAHIGPDRQRKMACGAIDCDESSGRINIVENEDEISSLLVVLPAEEMADRLAQGPEEYRT